MLYPFNYGDRYRNDSVLSSPGLIFFERGDAVCVTEERLLRPENPLFLLYRILRKKARDYEKMVARSGILCYNQRYYKVKDDIAMKHLRKVFIYIILVYLKTKKKIACEYQTFSFNLQIEKESRMKKKCILSLGSNEEAEKNMQFMCQRLIEKFPGILLSKAVYTEPVDFFSEKHFLNRTAILETEMNVEQIKTYLKDIEKMFRFKELEAQK